MLISRANHRIVQAVGPLSAAMAGIALSQVVGLARGDESRPASAPPPAHGRSGPTTRPAPLAAKTVSLSGAVTGFNLGPRGEIESLLLRDAASKVVQVNFPPPAAPEIQQSVALGDSITVTAVPRLSMPDHPVYDLISLTGPNGPKITVPTPGDRKEGHVEGTVKQINYDREGRPNGVILDTGDFVQIGPEVEKLDLKEGSKVSADGMQEPMQGSHTAIRANKVNDQEITPPPPPHRGPAGRRMGRRMGGPRPHGNGAPGFDGPNSGPGDDDNDGPPPGDPRGNVPRRRHEQGQAGSDGPDGFVQDGQDQDGQGPPPRPHAPPPPPRGDQPPSAQ